MTKCEFCTRRMLTPCTVAMQANKCVNMLTDWSPESHLGALNDPVAPTSGKIIPGKSRRIKR
jgi:hypothetical protein